MVVLWTWLEKVGWGTLLKEDWWFKAAQVTPVIQRDREGTEERAVVQVNTYRDPGLVAGARMRIMRLEQANVVSVVRRQLGGCATAAPLVTKGSSPCAKYVVLDDRPRQRLRSWFLAQRV